MIGIPDFISGRDLGDENDRDVQKVESVLAFGRAYDRVQEQLSRIKPIDPSTIRSSTVGDPRARFK